MWQIYRKELQRKYYRNKDHTQHSRIIISIPTTLTDSMLCMILLNVYHLQTCFLPLHYHITQAKYATNETNSSSIIHYNISSYMGAFSVDSKILRRILLHISNNRSWFSWSDFSSSNLSASTSNPASSCYMYE